MKLAAIDIGSNSIHLIIVQIHRDGHYSVVDRAREMVGLASRTLSDGYLSEEAVSRGLECLHTYRRIADAQGVDAIVAVATSAVREAANREHFVRLIRGECDIEVDVISGKEEARLIYLGARSHIDWAERRALIVDIGGGSVEFVVGTKDRAELFASLKLGVRRLAEEFLKSDPPTPTELKALRTHIEKKLGRFVRKLSRRHEFDFVVGTSGTLNNLAYMGALREGNDIVGRHGQWVNLSTLKNMGRELAGLSLTERGAYPGLDPKRSDNIVAGAQLIKYILRAMGKESYVACDYALRDGLVVDYIERHGPGRRNLDDIPDVRRRSVQQLYRKFNQSGAHPRQVTQLALSLFDQLAELHEMGVRERELLEYASLLHDIGHIISHKGHHKHTQYLITNGELHGFDRSEVDKIGLVARYHRRRFPKKREPAYRALSKRERGRVSQMAAILRVANALDRAHSNNVSSVSTRVTSDAVHIDVYTRTDASLELWALDSNTELFEKVFGRAVTFSAQQVQQVTMPWFL